MARLEDSLPTFMAALGLFVGLVCYCALYKIQKFMTAKISRHVHRRLAGAEHRGRARIVGLVCTATRRYA